MRETPGTPGAFWVNVRIGIRTPFCYGYKRGGSFDTIQNVKISS